MAMPGYLASTASSRTKTDTMSGGTAGHRQYWGTGSGASASTCDDVASTSSSPPKQTKRRESFLRKSVLRGVASLPSHVPSRGGGGAGGTAGTISTSASGRGASMSTSTSRSTNRRANQPSTKPKTCGQRTQASKGIRRRFQRGTKVAAKRKMPPKTPPRVPGKQHQKPAVSPSDLYDHDDDEDDEDDDLTLLTSLTSDLSLSMSLSSPDRSASPQTPPTAQMSITNRRIERAAAALDAAGHQHLEEGRVGDALEAYRRALKLKRRLLHDITGGGSGGQGGGILSPIAQGEEAMLGTSSSTSASHPRKHGTDDGSVGTSSSGHDPHREALLASVATSVNNVCYARQRMGLASPDEALTAYQSSLELKRRIRAEKVGLLSENNDNGEASAEIKLGETKPTCKKRDELTDQEQHDLSVAKTLNNIGTVHLSTGNYPSALSSFRESCGLMLAILGPHHIDVSTVHSNAGDALLGMKRYGEATEEYGRALKIRAARSGMDHRKSQRLLEKIRVAAKAAEVAKKREEEGERKEAERSSSVPSSPKSPALSVETLQRWFGETDVRDFCLLTEQCESDEEDDDLFGDLKSQLENDLDRITNIGQDLEEEIMKEQAAFMEEIKKMDDATDPTNDKTDEHEVKNEAETDSTENSATDTIARGDREAPRRIRSAADANDAVREVRERLAKVRARRNQAQLDNGLDALRRVPVTSSSGNNDIDRISYLII